MNIEYLKVSNIENVYLIKLMKNCNKVVIRYIIKNQQGAYCFKLFFLNFKVIYLM